jgi:hypothetical protein
MTTFTTFPHGTTATPTTPGYDVHNQAGQLTGRVHIRRDFSGRRWLADCFAFDGYEWTLDARTSPATLADTRATVRTWCEAIDRHAHNCRLPN